MRHGVFLLLLWFALLSATSPRVSAYVLDDKLWTDSTVTMQLQLDPTPLGRTLIDGSTSWNQVAQVAFNEWNANMQRMQFAVVLNSNAPIGRPNNQNNVFFSNTVYGDSWGSGVVGVAITYTTSTRRTESDVLFNSNRSWDSYRGNLRSALDFKRVALHEFGHVVGLDHPDQSGQSVTAVMNSIISNLDSLSADDRAGAVAGYGAPSGGGGTAPTIVGVSYTPTVNAGSSVSFTVSVTGTSPFTYQWYKGIAPISGATGVTLTLLNVQPIDSGSYTVLVTNGFGSASSLPAVLTVNAPTPQILGHPTNQTVFVGGSASFSVTASGIGTLTYQWFRNSTLISGATNSVLSLSNVQAAQAGSYTVVVTNTNGSVTSNAALLVVNEPPSGPTISTHPNSFVGNEGDAFTLSVVASGTSPLQYQWLRDGVPLPGATASTLLLSSLSFADAGIYTVLVSNSAGSRLSNPATVTVIAGVALPVIVTAPSSRSVSVGSPVSFSVVATGGSPLSYVWRKNDVIIPYATLSSLTFPLVQLSNAGSYTVAVSNSVGTTISLPAVLTVTPAAVAPTIQVSPASQTVVSGASVTFSVTAGGTAPLSYQWLKNDVAIAGATSATLALSLVQVSDAGSYSVRVSNSAGTVTSTPAVLTVNHAPVIVTSPSSQTVLVGTSVTFGVSASGTAPLTYQWRKGGVNIASANQATLAIPNVQTSDGGSYSVIVSNALGSATSTSATLTVLVPTSAPVILTQPASQVATVGGSVTMAVQASGTPPLSYQWRKGAANLVGAIGATLVLNSVQESDAGVYTVLVSNSAGTTTSASAVLTVNLPAVAPTLQTVPLSQTVVNGTNVTFSVTAGGSAPLFFQWLKNALPIAGATNATLALSSVQASDAGSYSVRVSNSAGSVTTIPAVLTVYQTPVIVSQPLSQIASVGGSATMTVQATGTAPLSYQWRKGAFNVVGATSPSLVLSPVQESDAGAYTVVVSNPAGATTSASAVLTVTVPAAAPTIQISPASQTVVTGASVTFSVTAGGTSPLSFQWFRNGETLPGANQPTLFIPSAQNVDAGSYAVSISNAAGSVTSSPVTLLVLPPVVAPAISESPGSRSVPAGGSTSFTVSVTGSAPFTYQWLRNGITLSATETIGPKVSMLTTGATSQTLTLTNLQTSDAGDYTVAVSNAAGTATSPPATLVVTPPLGSRISNVSIRTTLAANQPLIVGLSMAGGTKPVLVRAVGPGLAAFGVGNAMPDPELAFYGAGQLLAGNDDWGGGGDLASAFSSVGAFGLAPNSLDAALLGPVDGGRTAQVSGPVGGNVLVEAYDAGTGNTPRLINVSARNRVGSGGDVLIAGFTLTGNTTKTVLIRAVGPTLAGFGVPGTLANPRLEVYSGATRVDGNDDWPAALAATFERVGAFALTPGSRDSALLLTLPPGGYTVQVSGAGGTAGEALIELYEVPSP